MKTHEIKLYQEYCDAVLNGEKTFEIRINDRAYQKGDHVRFIPVSRTTVILHEIKNHEYEITYVLSGFGIKKDYVVFAIKEV